MKRIFILVVMFIVINFLVSLLMIFCFNIPTLLSDGRLDVNILQTNSLATSLALILAAIMMVFIMFSLNWTDRRSFNYRIGGLKVYAGGVLLMIPAIYLVNVFTELIALDDHNADMFRVVMDSPLGIFALVVTGPVSEEILFRMGIQRHLMRHNYFRPELSILAASVIFGIMHDNPAQIPGAIVLGYILGWLYWRSGSIWLPIVAHVFNNAAGILLFDISLNDLFADNLLMQVVLVVVASLWLVIMYRCMDRLFPENLRL